MRTIAYLHRQVLSLDRRLPLALKVLAPLLVITWVTAAAYALKASHDLESALYKAYAEQAHHLAEALAATLPADRADRSAIESAIGGLVSAEQSIERVRVYGSEAGAPVVRASFGRLTTPQDPPGAWDLPPAGLTLQKERSIGGTKVLETSVPAGGDGDARTAIGVYTSLAARDEAVAAGRRRIVLAAAAGVLGVSVAVWLSLHLLVLRRVERLAAVARRVAAGDLTARLAEGAEPPGRDHMVNIMREFDHMVASLQKLTEAEKRWALTDPLTSLYNRRHLDLSLGPVIAEAQASGKTLAVVVADIDRFKALNDTHGHLQGDEVLRAVAKAVTHEAPPDALCWRFGGDEFVVALPGADQSGAGAFAARAADAIGLLQVPGRAGRPIPISVSFGFAVYPEDGDSADALIRAADSRMYEAKSRSPARVLSLLAS